MNFIEKQPDRSRRDSGHIKLGLSALCAAFVLVAIDKQLDDQDRSHQADCVHCSDDAGTASAGQLSPERSSGGQWRGASVATHDENAAQGIVVL